MNERQKAAIARRAAQGCEEPGTCEWLRVHRIEAGREEDYSRAHLCDFHREVLELGLKAAKAERRSLYPKRAIALHPAAWRARR